MGPLLGSFRDWAGTPEGWLYTVPLLRFSEFLDSINHNERLLAGLLLVCSLCFAVGLPGPFPTPSASCP